MTEVLLVLGGFALISAVLGYYALVVMPKQVAAQRRENLRVFSTAIELRFPSHRGLTERVVMLARAVALDQGLTEPELTRLELAAWLREMGLCAVPWKLINEKPAHEWTVAERATFDRHPEVGAAMLELVPTLRGLAPIVRCFRAPYDGTAGPTFPKGQDLPIEARVLTLVDRYLTQERLQGAVLAWDDLIQQRGKLLDPALVEALRRVLPSTSAVTDSELVGPSLVAADFSERTRPASDRDRVGSSD